MTRRRFFTLAVFGSLLVATGLPLSIQPAFAQDAAAVAAFLADPQSLLKQYPNPNPNNPNDPMIAMVKGLALASPQTLLSLLSLLPNANKEEKQALGKGLAAAAAAVVATNPTYANDILQAITKTRDHELVLAATSGNPTGGTGGGAGGGGAVGGQTNTIQSIPSQTGPAQGIGSGSVPTGPFTTTSGVSGASGITNTTTFTPTSP
jgi:hypothetical protein